MSCTCALDRSIRARAHNHIIVSRHKGGDEMLEQLDAQPFRLEGARSAGVHAAIKAGQIPCGAIVQHYTDRVRVYRGVAGALSPQGGPPVPEARGAVGARAPRRFPTATVKASTVLPDL